MQITWRVCATYISVCIHWMADLHNNVQDGRDRWMELMKESLDEMNFPPEATQPMLGFFEHMSTHMINAQ